MRWSFLFCYIILKVDLDLPLIKWWYQSDQSIFFSFEPWYTDTPGQFLHPSIKVLGLGDDGKFRNFFTFFTFHMFFIFSGNLNPLLRFFLVFVLNLHWTWVWILGCIYEPLWFFVTFELMVMKSPMVRARANLESRMSAIITLVAPCMFSSWWKC